MINRKELQRARARVKAATESLDAIRSLPRRVGESVRWRNGVVWTRVGDDAWIPDSDCWRRSSEHVASFPFERVTR